MTKIFSALDDDISGIYINKFTHFNPFTRNALWFKALVEKIFCICDKTFTHPNPSRDFRHVSERIRIII